jgi:hypothetical protein
VDALLFIIVAVTLLVAFDVAALRYGVDSRGGLDKDQFRIPRV